MNCSLSTCLLAASLLAAACGGGCPDDFLQACARARCADKVKEALAKDASLTAQRGSKGRTPLHIAASGEIAEALIAAGADIEAQSGEQQTPLSEAMYRGRGDVVKVLLARGAKVFDLKQLLHTAVRDGHPSVIEAVIGAGGVPGEDDLLHAVINDKVDVAEALLRHGVSAKASMGANMSMISFGGPPTGKGPEDVSGKTALELAKSDTMRELLRKHGG